VLAVIGAASQRHPTFEQEASELSDRLETLLREFDKDVEGILTDARNLSARIGRHILKQGAAKRAQNLA